MAVSQPTVGLFHERDFLSLLRLQTGKLTGSISQKTEEEREAWSKCPTLSQPTPPMTHKYLYLGGEGDPAGLRVEVAVSSCWHVFMGF